MSQYLAKVRSLVDSLTSTGTRIDPEDLFLYVLNSLPSSYLPFKTTIRINPSPLHLDEFSNMLLSEELHLVAEFPKDSHPLDITALFTSKDRRSTPPIATHGRNPTSHGGRSHNQTRHSPVAPTKSMKNQVISPAIAGTNQTLSINQPLVSGLFKPRPPSGFSTVEPLLISRTAQHTLNPPAPTPVQIKSQLAMVPPYPSPIPTLAFFPHPNVSSPFLPSYTFLKFLTT